MPVIFPRYLHRCFPRENAPLVALPENSSCVKNSMNRLCVHAVCQIIFHSVSTIGPNPEQLPQSLDSVDQILKQADGKHAAGKTIHAACIFRSVRRLPESLSHSVH